MSKGGESMDKIEVSFLEEEWDDEDVSFCTTSGTHLTAEVAEDE